MTTRRATQVLLAGVLCAVGILPLGCAVDESRPPEFPPSRVGQKDLEVARYFDNEGARAYGAARFNEALVLFAMSYRRGGPSIELWNMAKCYLKLDQVEKARSFFEAFAASSDASPQERKDVTRELTGLRERRSLLVVHSKPQGELWVDGKRLGPSPMTAELTYGPHEVVLKVRGQSVWTTRVQSEYGRPLVFDLVLSGE